jgi:hypothetical protein
MLHQVQHRVLEVKWFALQAQGVYIVHLTSFVQRYIKLFKTQTSSVEKNEDFFYILKEMVHKEITAQNERTTNSSKITVPEED